MKTTNGFSIPIKIAAAAVVILIVDAAILLIFGDRTWRGLETLLTAANLVPLSALFWPIVEALASSLWVGSGYLGRKIRGKWKREPAQAYQSGYAARIAEEAEGGDENSDMDS